MLRFYTPVVLRIDAGRMAELADLPVVAETARRWDARHDRIAALAA